MNYPPMSQNPLCRCAQRGPMAGMAAMFCLCGHMTECHYPFTCEEAACGHLHAYGFEDEEIERLEDQARELITAGLRPPYVLDSEGNVIVVLNPPPEQTKNPRTRPRV